MSVEQLIHSLKTENQFNHPLFQSLLIDQDEDIDRVTLVALQCASDDVFMNMVDRGWIVMDMFLLDEILHFQRLDLLKRVLEHKNCQIDITIENVKTAAIRGNMKELMALLPFYKYKTGDEIDSDWCEIEKDYQTKSDVRSCIDYLINHPNIIKWYNRNRINSE